MSENCNWICVELQRILCWEGHNFSLSGYFENVYTTFRPCGCFMRCGVHSEWLAHALPWWTWKLEVVYRLLLDLVWMFERFSSSKCWINMELGDFMLLMHEGILCAWSRVGYFTMTKTSQNQHEHTKSIDMWTLGLREWKCRCGSP